MFSKRFLMIQIAFVIVALVLTLLYLNGSILNPGLPIRGTVNDFALKDQNGQPVTLSNFKGKVWVADFIFTTCGGICPMMTKSMSNLHKAFADDDGVRMVSISVNPENDTPEQMAKYAKKNEAKGDRWVFLTGERDVIQKLAVESFKMGDMKDIVFHSSYFALVDRKARIRGYYDGMDEGSLGQLHTDLDLLRKER